METKVNRELRCVHRKTTFEEDLLGLVLRPSYYEKPQFEIKAIYTDLQYVSQTWFKEGGTSSQRQREFLPLLINEEHSKKAFPVIEALFTRLGNWKSFHPYMVLNYIPKLLNYTVIGFVTQFKEDGDVAQQAEQTVLKYAHFHHMLLAFARRYPEIVVKANKKLKEFKESADKREKKVIPDLGEFLTHLALSTEVQWRDFAIPFLKEFLERNTLYIIRKYPDLNNIKESRDTCFRLTQSFEVTSTARRILMYQLLFIHLISAPTTTKGEERIAELVEAYNRRLGEPPAGVQEKLLKAVTRINQVDSWNSFFDNVRVNHLDPLSLTDLLKESVTNGFKKRYHPNPQRNDNPRDVTVCLCNQPGGGCKYQSGNSPAPKTSTSSGTSQPQKQKSKSIPAQVASPTSSQPTKPIGNAWKNPLTIKPLAPPSLSSASINSNPSPSTPATATATSPGQNKNLWRPKGKDQKLSPQPNTAPLGNNSFPNVSLGHTIGHTIIDPANSAHLGDQVSLGRYGQHLEINPALVAGDSHHGVDLNSLAADIAASHDLSPPITDLDQNQTSTSHPTSTSQVIKRETKLKREERDSGLNPFAKPFVPGLLWLTSDQQQPVYRSTHTRSRPDKSRLPNAETDPSMIHEPLTDSYLYRPLASGGDGSLLSLLSPGLADPSWTSSNLAGSVMLTPPPVSKSFSDQQQLQQQTQQQPQQYTQEHTYHQDPANSFGVQVPAEDTQRVQPKRERQDSQKGRQEKEKQPEKEKQEQRQDKSQEQRQEKQEQRQEKEREKKDSRKKEPYRSRENSRSKEDRPRTRSTNEERKTSRDEKEHTDDREHKGKRRPLTRLTPNPAAAAAAARARSKPEPPKEEKSALHEITQKLASTHAQTQGAKRARDPLNPWGFPRTVPQTETKPEQKRVSKERTASAAKEESKDVKQDSKRKSRDRKSSESEQPKREPEQPRRTTLTQPTTPQPQPTSSAPAPRSKNNPWGNIAVTKTSIVATFAEQQSDENKSRKIVTTSGVANVYASAGKTETKTPGKRALPSKPSGQTRTPSEREGRETRGRGEGGGRGRGEGGRGRGRRDNRDFPKRDNNREFPRKRDPSDNRDFPKKPHNRDFPRPRDNNYTRRDRYRRDQEGDGRRGEDNFEPKRYRDDEDGRRPRRPYYSNRRRRSEDNGDQRGEDGGEDGGNRPRRSFRRRDSEDEDGYRRAGRYHYRRGDAERSDWRNPEAERQGGEGDRLDREREDDGRDRRGWEEDEDRQQRRRREPRRDRTDSESRPQRAGGEEPAAVSNRYSSLQQRKPQKEGGESEEEVVAEEGSSPKQKRSKTSDADKPQTNGMAEDSEKPQRRFALPDRAVKALRPVTDAKAVESNDVTSVRKQLRGWEQKQLKESALQQRRAEQSQRERRGGGGGRRWGDIMERTDGRGRGGGGRRDDRRGGRRDERDEEDQARDREEHGENGGGRSQDIEIDDREIESSSKQHKESVGSDADDHSFDDEPKKTASSTQD